jgi:hypothetical protein
MFHTYECFSLRACAALACFCLSVAAPAPNAFADDGRWTSLFDGETLEDWEMLEGEGKFFVEDRQIVAETTEGASHCYLCTERTFENFVLEIDFKVDEGFNSGVQIRTTVHTKKGDTDYLNGKNVLTRWHYEPGDVVGYQIEIDPSGRQWTGGLYECGSRGWLQTLEYNEPARKAYKPGEWNRFRIEAVDDSIKSWINGVPAVDTRDAWRRDGRIGLQLHSAKEPGLQIHFRNIRIKEME